MGTKVKHPIDAEIRIWLKRHVENEKQLSVAAGHSTSWLHKYVNGSGHATIDDLIRLAGLLMGLNLPALSVTERSLLTVVRDLEESDRQDVIDYAKHRSRLAQRGGSKESSERADQTPPVIVHKARGKR